MERIRTELEIALKGSRELVSAKQKTRVLGLAIQQTAQFIKNFQQDNEGLVKSVGNLNSLLSASKSNLNNVALGTKQAMLH